MVLVYDDRKEWEKSVRAVTKGVLDGVPTLDLIRIKYMPPSFLKPRTIAQRHHPAPGTIGPPGTKDGCDIIIPAVPRLCKLSCMFRSNRACCDAMQFA